MRSDSVTMFWQVEVRIHHSKYMYIKSFFTGQEHCKLPSKLLVGWFHQRVQTQWALSGHSSVCFNVLCVTWRKPSMQLIHLNGSGSAGTTATHSLPYLYMKILSWQHWCRHKNTHSQKSFTSDYPEHGHKQTGTDRTVLTSQTSTPVCLSTVP